MKIGNVCSYLSLYIKCHTRSQNPGVRPCQPWWAERRWLVCLKMGKYKGTPSYDHEGDPLVQYDGAYEFTKQK